MFNLWVGWLWTNSIPSRICCCYSNTKGIRRNKNTRIKRMSNYWYIWIFKFEITVVSHPWNCWRVSFEKKIAIAGTRTRIASLEGWHAAPIPLSLRDFDAQKVTSKSNSQRFAPNLDHFLNLFFFGFELLRVSIIESTLYNYY